MFLVTHRESEHLSLVILCFIELILFSTSFRCIYVKLYYLENTKIAFSCSYITCVRNLIRYLVYNMMKIFITILGLRIPKWIIILIPNV